MAFYVPLKRSLLTNSTTGNLSVDQYLEKYYIITKLITTIDSHAWLLSLLLYSNCSISFAVT